MMRMFLVLDFLPEVTQHIHSLRANGVMSSHSARIDEEEMMAFLRSAGSACTVPAGMLVVPIAL
jgi:hypothetical protein